MSGQFYFVLETSLRTYLSECFDSSKLRAGFEDIDFGLDIFISCSVNLYVREMVWVHDFYLTKTEKWMGAGQRRISSGQILLPSRRDMLSETDSHSLVAERCGQNYSEKHT